MKTHTVCSLFLMSFFINETCLAQLIVDAGADTAFCDYNWKGAVIGGNPSAEGGMPPYTYAWSAEFKGVSRVWPASSMLEDTTVSNPIGKTGVIPDSVVFYLFVKDANDSTAIDSVEVRSSRYGSCLEECRYYIKLGDSAQLGHCVFGGIPPYQFSWTPSASLSDSTSETPWAKPSSYTLYELYITDSYGCQTRSTCKVFIDATDIESIGAYDNYIHVYPNPVRNMIRISINQIPNSSSLIEILTIEGKIVRRIIVDKPLLTVDVTDFVPGIYLYQWKSRNELIESGKFVIQYRC
jgi:hypothetical protein